MIIGGLPHNFEINKALQNIMETLNTTCRNNDVLNTKIMPSKNTPKNNINTTSSQQNNSFPLILVEFKTNAAKREVINKKKVKKSLLVNEIGLNSSAERQIFIREHVTNYKMNLFNECRELRNQYDFKYLCMNGTSILMRKQEQSKVFEINSCNYFNKIVLFATNTETQSRSENSCIIFFNKFFYIFYTLNNTF